MSTGKQPAALREHWRSRLGFILAAAGSAVGLGNIWRFPHVTGTNGGAIFLLIYLVTVAIIGYPLFVNEMVLGRRTGRNPVGAFRALAPRAPWWLAGALGVFTGFVILAYYSVVAGWSLAYTWQAVAGGFPDGADFAARFVAHISRPGMTILWHGVFMILCTAVIAAGVVRGIEKTVTVLMPLLFLLVAVLIGRALTLPGAGAGIAFFLRPDYTQLSARTFLDAIAQSFFTLSLGMGAIITYGSYLSRREEIPGNALAVIGLDTGIAVLAGLAIFPAVFALGFAPDAGPQLIFITLPAVFARLPLGSYFGFLFFLLLSIAALTSAISLLEVVVAWAVDEHRLPRPRAAILLGGAIFLAGLPPALGYSQWSGFRFLGHDLLDTYDWFANSLFLPLGGLLAAIFTGYAWGAGRARDEANLVPGRIRVGRGWVFLIRFIIPAAIVLIMFFGLHETFARR